MSLIQEALKRQQMEQEGKLPPGGDSKATPPLKSTVVDGETFILPGAMTEPAETELTEAPARPTLKRNVRPAPELAPGPPAPPVAEPEPERKRVSPTPAGDEGAEKDKPRVLPVLAAMIILLLLLAAALAWAVSYGLERAGVRMPWAKAEPAVSGQPAADPASADGTDKVKVAETPAVKPAEAPASAHAAAPAKKPTIGSVVRKTVNAANAAAADSNVVIADAISEKPVESEPPSQAVPVMEPTSTATVPEPPDVAAVTAPETPEPPPASLIKWPDITISGVVGKEQKGAVFVNGKVIGVNETVEGIRVLAIKPQGALLEYQGETRLAKVGQPLNRATR